MFKYLKIKLSVKALDAVELAKYEHFKEKKRHFRINSYPRDSYYFPSLPACKRLWSIVTMNECLTKIQFDACKCKFMIE